MSFNTQVAMKMVANELVRIKDIEISNRFRKDVGDVSDLSISIKNIGLIHPISITKNGKLVAGRRRIEAFKKLGLEEIPANTTDIKIKEDGEIDENSIRKDFTAEEMVAVKKYLDAREINLESQFQIKPCNNRPPTVDNQGRPKFGLPKRCKRIAKRIGRSDTTLKKLEELHDAASKDPNLFDDLWQKVNSNIRNTDKMYKIYRRRSYREQILKECKHAQLVKSDNIKLIHGDFIKVSKEIPDDSVDLICTDPPYDKKSLQLYKELALLANRVLKPGGSVVCYAGTYAIPQILDYMKEANLTYYWISSIILQGPFDKAWREHITIKWKPLLYHIKGTRKFDTTEYMSDVIISTKPNKLLHEWQQSTKEPEHVIPRLTVQNQTILDPMMGSGTTGIAALNLKRRFIGIELEKETFKLAAARLNQFQASQDSDNMH